MANELSCHCRRRLASGFDLDAELRIPLDESPVTVLFGPSGAGKTTLLRLLAGLDRPDDGAITFRDSVWYDESLAICLPPQQRRAVFLFQDCALFPHLTVAANVEYAARGEVSRSLPPRALRRTAAARGRGARAGRGACALALG
jgi:molybdate transport system ATP-binding protein